MRLWRVPYPKFGHGPGLERVSAIADKLGLDLAGFGEKGAVIVGSNGKGSTAAMTAALLAQGGANVGLFTSPHLFALNERFRIGDEDISDEELEHHWDRVAAAVEVCGKTGELGGFEFLFLVAADWFAARGCAHTVWEAGIGARLDPVRLIRPKVVALTSLDLEHTALLGSTLEEIGLDKVEAAPPGATIYAAVWTSVREVLARHCAAIGVRYVTVPPYYSVDLSLIGKHQNQNAALALSLAMAILDVDEGVLAPYFAATRWPGRLEVIGNDSLIVIDVGHTPAAIAAARAGFDAMRGGRDAVLVCGASVDKEVAALIGALAPGFSTIICAAARHKGAPAAEIASAAYAANPQAELVIADSVAEARRLALAKARPIYVAGGLFLAAEFKWVHLGRDPALLAFF
ncbi:glutamate ligase domain-containing protein [Terricaulis silvestris]|uniref:Dihydrofolate synthase/folylpolyglutamate synthase n=1 Tax=Terricaulis silvestris TaxID=2686094 RepID=A0A6I6MUX4_9CAUL|nr:cyanophycin synthetase [Terricaulis silvestris]QGZ94973.1 Folylpolyglutamate synthase [Terricaulis silvestris]